MVLSNILKASKEKINPINNLLTNIGKELSLIIWVTIVFLLIVCSYLNNEYNLLEKQEFDLYEDISISDEIENNIQFMDKM